MQAMCFQTRDCLRVGSISLSKAFFSTTMLEREAIKQIRDELCRFSIVVQPPASLFGQVRKTYTGKLGGQQDDLSIVIQLAITGLRTFYSTPKYSSFRPEV